MVLRQIMGQWHWTTCFIGSGSDPEETPIVALLWKPLMSCQRKSKIYMKLMDLKYTYKILKCNIKQQRKEKIFCSYNNEVIFFCGIITLET